MRSSQQIKGDFPFFINNGKDLIFLDNAATTQKPKQVIDAIVDYYTNWNSNVRRGIYRLSEEATGLYDKSRENISRFIDAEHPGELAFVRNATEALNLLAYSLGHDLNKGDEILLTIMEHHSNIVPWQFLQEKGVKVKFAEINEDGTLDMDDFQSKLTGNTKIVSVTHCSNLLGTINDAATIGKLAHENGSLFVLDAAQSVPHMPVDVRKLDCDFMAFSGHKMLGPMGIGVLYGKYDLLNGLPPFNGGGEMIRQVWKDHSTYADAPERFEAGTPNVEGAIGLSAAVDYLRGIGMDNVRAHEKDLISYTLKKEEECDINILKSYGPRDPEKRGGIYTFNLGEFTPMSLGNGLMGESINIGSNVHPHDVASGLDSNNVAVRAGHHCAMPLTHRLNVVATSRASYYIYNSREDIDKLFESLDKVRRLYA